MSNESMDELDFKQPKKIVGKLISVDVLGKIRAEIDKARFTDKDTRICKNALASGLELALEIIDKYAALEQEQKIGKWELTDDEQSYCCSCCKNHWISASEYLDVWKYCPNCGAKMTVEEKSCSNCIYWCLDENDGNRRCQYCVHQDEWQPESEVYQ